MYKTVKVQPLSETVRPANFFLVLLFPNRKPGRVAMPNPFLPLRNPSSFMYNMVQYSHARVSFHSPAGFVNWPPIGRFVEYPPGLHHEFFNMVCMCLSVCARVRHQRGLPGHPLLSPFPAEKKESKHTKNSRTSRRESPTARDRRRLPRKSPQLRSSGTPQSNLLFPSSVDPKPK
jgi:hypothetical protein